MRWGDSESPIPFLPASLRYEINGLFSGNILFWARKCSAHKFLVAKKQEEEWWANYILFGLRMPKIKRRSPNKIWPTILL